MGDILINDVIIAILRKKICLFSNRLCAYDESLEYIHIHPRENHGRY